jgi:ribosome-associated protein
VRLAQIADEHKALDVAVLDLRPLGYLTDYFVLASGTNPRQLRAIAEEVQREAREARVRLLGAEGLPDSRWVLLDFVDVVLHLFEPTTRAFYGLETLWGDAARVAWRRFKRLHLADLTG